jgi:hypothetical protein
LIGYKHCEDLLKAT